ncbi:hypothetical protein MMC30_000914 [Trapelia coarctata]|nr:hypothetical protein [Trapelia coarctata]
MILSRPALPSSRATQARRLFSSSIHTAWKPIPVLLDSDLQTFRKFAFIPSTPALLPKGSFTGLPAVSKWFQPAAGRQEIYDLNHDYLRPFGSATVPLELTTSTDFVRSEAPLALFLEWIRRASAPSRSSHTQERFYLAQASLDDLPQQLREDFPVPPLVTSAGRGDVYAVNLWIGLSPTYTPLHSDPNPNLFVQLVGTKKIRLLDPIAGQRTFANVQARLGGLERVSEKYLGPELMQGVGKDLHKAQIWSDPIPLVDGEVIYEAHLEGGDALFIPNGWWHSIKGTGEGVTASVSLTR